MKKIFTSILCILLSVALLPMGVFAVVDFDSDYGNLELGYYSGGTGFADINVTEGGAFAYEGGIGGKSATDYSMVVRVGGDTSDASKYDISKTGTNANAFVSLHAGNKEVSIQDGRLYEFDAYVDGDIKLMVQPTSTVAQCFVTPEICKGKWVHVAAWLPKASEDGKKHFYVYVNGAEIGHGSASASSVGIYRMRLVYWLTANKTNLDGMIAIDNYSVTTGLDEYTPEYEIPAYTSDDISFMLNGYEAREFYYGDFATSLRLDTIVEQSYPPSLIVAQYDENDNLIECIIGATAPDKAEVVANCHVDRTNGTYLRVYVWNSFGSMHPAMTDEVVILPGDGTQPGQKMYFNEAFDDDDLTIATMLKTGNTLTVENGYARFEKGSADSCYFNMSFKDASDYVVLEADFRNGAAAEDKVTSANLFFVRDSLSSESNIDKNLVNLKNGVISESGKSFTLNDSPGDWTRMSLAVDVLNGKCDLYCNGVIQKENIVIRSNFAALNVWRIFLTGGEDCTTGVLEIDNIRAYDGTAPRDVKNQTASLSSIFSDTEALRFLRDKTALSPYANTIFYDYKKYDTDTQCIIEGDEALVSADTFEKLFGITPAVSGNTITAGDAVFTVGSEYMQLGGSSIEIEAAPRLAGGQVMIPVRAYGTNDLGDKFYDDSHGMLVVSDSSIADGDYSEANRFLFNTRYSASELEDKLMANLGGDIKKHPRILATGADFARIISDVQTDANMKKWYNSVISSANSITKRSDVFPAYDVSSGRLTTQANKAFTEVLQLGFAYQITGDTKYSDRAIEIMKIVCAYPDWYPDHALGTGALAMAVAVGFDWCYDQISEDDKTYIMEKARQHGLETAYDLFHSQASFDNQFWHSTETNWGSVVNAGIINLAFSIAEMDIDYTMNMAADSLRSLEYPVYHIAPDGAWHEGPSYWNYFFQYLSYALAGYETAIGEQHNAIYHKGMDGMVRFQPYFTDPNGKYNNFNDADISSAESEVRLYISSRRDMPEIMNHCVDFVNSGKYNISQQFRIFAMLWYDKDMISDGTDLAASLPLDGYFRDTEFVSMRQNWTDSDALWFSATGGTSDSSHSQLDSGSFVLTLDGVRWATDLGKEDGYYSRTGGNAATNAGYTNLHYYRRKAEGHNMVVINPDDNLEIDKNAFAQIQAPVGNGDMAYTSVDLSAAYAGKADNYTRGYMLADGRRSLKIRDEINLSADNSVLYWFMHTDGTISLLDSNTATITQSGKTLKVVFEVEGTDCEHELMIMDKKPLVDLGFEQETNSGSKLAVKLLASGSVAITAKMYMADEEADISAIDVKPIAEWKLN